MQQPDTWTFIKSHRLAFHPARTLRYRYRITEANTVPMDSVRIEETPVNGCWFGSKTKWEGFNTCRPHVAQPGGPRH